MSVIFYDERDCKWKNVEDHKDDLGETWLDTTLAIIVPIVFVAFWSFVIHRVADSVLMDAPVTRQCDNSQ